MRRPNYELALEVVDCRIKAHKMQLERIKNEAWIRENNAWISMLNVEEPTADAIGLARSATEIRCDVRRIMTVLDQLRRKLQRIESARALWDCDGPGWATELTWDRNTGLCCLKRKTKWKSKLSLGELEENFGS